MKIKLPILLLMSVFCLNTSAVAEVISNNSSVKNENNIAEISKTINLSPNNPQLLSFDEKIQKYRVLKEKELSVEMINGIMNNRQELLLVPKMEAPNTLVVWTKTKMYLFNIQYSKENAEILKAEIPGVEEFNLDLPPSIKKSEIPVKLRELP